LLLCRILLGAWRPTNIMEIYNFCQAPVVGVPIAEVTNTLTQWLHWMVSSYAGHLGTKTTSLRSACLNI
jgi:hypothetical protein